MNYKTALNILKGNPISWFGTYHDCTNPYWDMVREGVRDGSLVYVSHTWLDTTPEWRQDEIPDMLKESTFVNCVDVELSNCDGVLHIETTMLNGNNFDGHRTDKRFRIVHAIDTVHPLIVETLEGAIVGEAQDIIIEEDRTLADQRLAKKVEQLRKVYTYNG